MMNEDLTPEEHEKLWAEEAVRCYEELKSSKVISLTKKSCAMSNPDSSRIFNPAARLEFIEATEYYRGISPRLQRKFIDAFEDAIADVMEFPEAAPQIAQTIAWRKHIRGFPYDIIYILDPDALYIVAVARER